MGGPLGPEFSAITDNNGDVLNVNPNGSISSSPLDGTKNTYSLCTSAISPPTTATDIFLIQGSKTKVIRVLRIEVTGTQTTAGQVLLILIKRLIANTGGTASTYLNWPGHDSENPPATATVLQYSANPVITAGAFLFVRQNTTFIPAALSVAATVPTVWTFGDRPGQAIVLRGVNEQLAINLNSVTITGGSFLVSVEWTEE